MEIQPCPSRRISVPADRMPSNHVSPADRPLDAKRATESRTELRCCGPFNRVEPTLHLQADVIQLSRNPAESKCRRIVGSKSGGCKNCNVRSSAPVARNERCSCGTGLPAHWGGDGPRGSHAVFPDGDHFTDHRVAFADWTAPAAGSGDQTRAWRIMGTPTTNFHPIINCHCPISIAIG
jgi:hypothetical protein